MPPVAKAGGTAFRKDVDFVAKDDDEQVAAGIVMVPDKADLQRDFAREGTIRDFADQFEAFVEAGQAGGGIMHAVWPDGWMELERNEVLDESEEIGGQTVDAGAWVQEWSIESDQLWGLIDDGILEGYSIGAIQVDWSGPYEQGDVDDVDTSEIPDDEMVWELIDGIIREVSAVDIPAVPDAEILEAKSLEKRLAEHIGNQDAFIEEAMERGHTEDEAERLWDVLNAAVEAEGSGEPGKQSTLLERVGKAAVSALTGSDDGADEEKSPEAPDVPAAHKAGQTLSQANQASAMAAIDANIDMLEDAGVDHGMERFTDREDVDFDLTEHSARTWEGDHGEDDDEDEGEEEMASTTDDAPEGDTSEAGSTDAADDMTDTDDTTTEDGDETEADADEAKAIAEQNAEQISELTAAVESLTETLTGPEPDTTEIELNGETYEVPESQVKAALGVDEDAGSEDIANAIESLKDDVDEQAARIDAISRQSGRGSQQLEASDENGDGGTESGLDQLGKALGGS